VVFASLPFVIWFLPATVLLHELAPKRVKNAALLLISVFFYAWGEPRFLPVIVGSVLVNYASARLSESMPELWRRVVFYATITINLAALVICKTAFSPDSMPLGISFYTFQSMAYVIDVYRRKSKTERNLVDYAAFIMLFPQLIAGPIVLYESVREDLRGRIVTAEDREAGISLFIIGLASKTLLANPLGQIWVAVQRQALPSAPLRWIGIIAFGLQIYYDFAGYSQMAIGMGRMLGFRFPQNFNMPYAACSVRDFWRRWHMTLGAWFREYVYIPLGGNRRGSLRTVINLIIVWSLTGLWHGAHANFLAWGLWFCAFLLLERFFIGEWLKKHRAAAWVYAQLVVLLGWVLFSLDSLPLSLSYAAGMFTAKGGADWQFLLRGNAVLLAVAVLFCVPKVCAFIRRCMERRTALRVACLFVLLGLNVASLVNAGYNPFLYFRF
jgi:alginate O-acetyltransferase complex protein AlgI